MHAKFLKTIACALLGTGMAIAATAVGAGDLSAERAQRLVFTPLNSDNLSRMSTNEEMTFRVDGLNLNAKLIHGVDIGTCTVKRINPGANVIASAEITDAENGVIVVKAGPAAGSAKLHLKCRNKQVSVTLRVS